MTAMGYLLKDAPSAYGRETGTGYRQIGPAFLIVSALVFVGVLIVDLVTGELL